LVEARKKRRDETRETRLGKGHTRNNEKCFVGVGCESTRPKVKKREGEKESRTEGTCNSEQQ
jgi:hypothetical protein